MPTSVSDWEDRDFSSLASGRGNETIAAICESICPTSPFAWCGANRTPKFARDAKQEDEHGFKEKPDKAERFSREGKSGQWHKGLTRRQVRRIVHDHHVQMTRFGYLTDELKCLV
jgi:hypothetical protein